MTAEATMTDDEVLSFAQGARRKLVEDIMVKGVPTDNDERNTMLRALEGMTTTALGNKRLRRDEQASSNEVLARQLLGQMFGILGSKNPMRSETAQTRTVPVDTSLEEPVEDVPGELDIGTATDTFETFAQRTDLFGTQTRA